MDVYLTKPVTPSEKVWKSSVITTRHRFSARKLICCFCPHFCSSFIYFNQSTFFFRKKNIPSNLSTTFIQRACIFSKFRLHFRHQHTLITHPQYFHQKLKYHLNPYRKRVIKVITFPKKNSLFFRYWTSKVLDL